MFHRFALTKLKDWITSRSRKVLLIQGARQVGKTTLVYEFAKQQNKRLITINLDEPGTSQHYSSIKTIDKLVENIKVLHNVSDLSQYIVFFDEIQSNSNIIKLLRYFYEKYPSVPVIASGSNLQIVLKRYNISFGVGRVQTLTLYPLTFFEFLYTANQQLYKYLNDIDFTKIKNFPPNIHDIAKKYWITYYVYGGMPKPLYYAYKNNGNKAFDELSDIINGYMLDLGKYTNSPLMAQKIKTLFTNVAANLGKYTTYNSLLPAHPHRTISNLLSILEDSHLVYLIPQTSYATKPHIINPKRPPKIIGIDLSLYNSIFNNLLVVSEYLPQKGGINEQLVGQILIPYFKPHLLTWSVIKSKGSAEIDFLIIRNKTIAIDVKSQPTGHLRSLASFHIHNPDSTLVRIYNGMPTIETLKTSILYQGKTHKIAAKLYSIPIYATEWITKI